MGNILSKRNLTIVALSAIAIGMIRKYAKKPENKNSFVTTLADSIGLTA